MRKLVAKKVTKSAEKTRPPAPQPIEEAVVVAFPDERQAAAAREKWGTIATGAFLKAKAILWEGKGGG